MNQALKTAEALSRYLESATVLNGSTPFPPKNATLKVKKIDAQVIPSAPGARIDLTNWVKNKSFVLLTEMAVNNPNYRGTVILFYDAESGHITKLHGWPTGKLYPYGRLHQASYASGVVALDFHNSMVYVPKDCEHYIIYAE